MYLQEFFDYKNRFMGDILTDNDIVKMINNDQDIDDPADLMYTQVFPYEYVPEVVEHGKTFICCDVDVTKKRSKQEISLVMYVWVFTHKSALRLPGGGVRTDVLCSKISEKILGSKFYGLGELDLGAVKRFSPMTAYQGKVMVFEATDISRYYNPKRPIPKNRRLG